MTAIFSNKIKTNKTVISDKLSSTGFQPADNFKPNSENKKLDSGLYKDSDDLSIKKMKIGLWFVENRNNFIKMFYVLLILIAIITWPIFIYYFGEYIIKGMANDKRMIDELAQLSVPLHDFSPSIRAKGIIYNNIEIISLPNDKMDLAVKATNPNENYWCEFTYFFKVGDREFGRSESFILPGESKYLMALNQDAAGSAGANIYMENLSWRQINAHKFPDWDKFKNEHLKIDVTNINFTPAQSTLLTEKINLNELDFILNNNSAYNYKEIGLPIALYSRSNLVGVNKYILENVVSGQSRQIKVTWPGRMDSVTDIEIKPEINITRDNIYNKFIGEPQKLIETSAGQD